MSRYSIQLRASRGDRAYDRGAVLFLLRRNVETDLRCQIRAFGRRHTERFEPEELENGVLLERDLGGEGDGWYAGEQAQNRCMEAAGDDYPAGTVKVGQLTWIEIVVDQKPAIELQALRERDAD